MVLCPLFTVWALRYAISNELSASWVTTQRAWRYVLRYSGSNDKGEGMAGRDVRSDIPTASRHTGRRWLRLIADAQESTAQAKAS